MSVESVLQRVAALEQALANPAALLAAASGGTAAPAQAAGGAPEATTAPGGSSFAQALQSATASYAGTAATSGSALASAAQSSPSSTADTALAGAPLTASYPAGSLTGLAGIGAPSPTAAGGGSIGARIVAIAESQAGQTEQPPGSNESPAIAQYRTATAGAIPGAPWCAYFASWAARQAGEPLGASGEGLGAVSEIWSWAQSSGRAIPNGPGVTPRPGDLIVFGDEHVGIVKDVLPDGDIQTIEGNYENKVALNTRTPTEATGYVNTE
jgi:CHAP domain